MQNNLNKHSKIINNINELQNFTTKIVNNLKEPIILLLKGNLGVGKTAFAKSFINNIASKTGNSLAVNVASPSFTLVNCYQFADYQIAHFDLYRLYQKPNFYQQLLHIDFFEFINSHFTLVEWPEDAIEFLTENYRGQFYQIEIQFFHQNNTTLVNKNAVEDFFKNNIANQEQLSQEQSPRIFIFDNDFASNFLLQ